MIEPSRSYVRQIRTGFLVSFLAFLIYGLVRNISLLLFSEFFPPSKFLPDAFHYLLYGSIAGALTILLISLLNISVPGRFASDTRLFRTLFLGYLYLNFLVHALIGLHMNFSRIQMSMKHFWRLQNPSFYSFLIVTTLFGLILLYFSKTRTKWSELWVLLISQYVFISFLLSALLLHSKLFKMLLRFRPKILMIRLPLYIGILLVGSVLSYVLCIRVYRFWRDSAIFSKRVKAGILALIPILLLVFMIYDYQQKRHFQKKADTMVKSKPNIVFIVIDTLRADRLSCYGYSRQTSPNIDALAREGVRYAKVIAPGGWTLPTHASIFSGMYVSKHGANLEGNYLGDDLLTMAEYFSGKGYYSVGFCNNVWISDQNGFVQGFQSYYEMWKSLSILYSTEELLWQVYKRNRYGMDRGDLHMLNKDAAITNRFILEWIEKNYPKQHPVFLFINYMDVHAPYKPQKTISYPFLSKADLKKSYNEDPAYFHFYHQKYDAEAIRDINLLYDGGIYYVDYQIGELFKKLFRILPEDDTIIIITSDHGESLGEHQMIGHDMMLYNTVISVPLIIRYPKLFDPGSVVSLPVQSVDIFPTLVRILDPDEKDVLSEMQGKSLMGLKEENRHPFLISEYFYPESWIRGWKKSLPDIDPSRIDVFNRRIKTIERGDYKLIQYSDGTVELYDIKGDPSEENNIIAENPEIASELIHNLEEWLKSFPHRTERRAENPIMDEETRKSLQALGYFVESSE